MMQNPHDEREPRALPTAEELRGKKAGGQKNAGGGRKKRGIVLLCLAAALCLAAGGMRLAQWLRPAQETPAATVAQTPQPAVELVNRPKDSVQSISIQRRGEESYTLACQASPSEEADTAGEVAYSLAGNDAFTVDQAMGERAMAYCTQWYAASLVEENVADLERFGLKEPALRVTVHGADGSAETWLFGDKAPTEAAYYLAKEGGNTVYLVYASAYNVFNHAVREWHSLELPVSFASGSDIRSATIAQSGEETVQLRVQEEGEEGISLSNIVLVQPFAYDAHSERAMEVLEGIAAFSVEAYAGQLGELVDTGLETPAASFAAEGLDGKELCVHVGNYQGETSRYVQIDDTDAVYLASAASLSFLSQATTANLVDQFSNIMFIDYVDAIHIRASGAQYELAIRRDGETTEYLLDGNPMQEDAFKSLYQQIIGVMVSQISDDRNLQGEVVASVSYELNRAPYSLEIEYLAYDDAYYAVRREGITPFLVRHAAVDSLLDGLAAAVAQEH